MLSIGPTWRTSSGVTISGQAPCSALVASTKRGSPRELGVALVVVVVDPGGEPVAELGEERRGHLVERHAGADRGRERDVEDDHAARAASGPWAGPAATRTRGEGPTPRRALYGRMAGRVGHDAPAPRRPAPRGPAPAPRGTVGPMSRRLLFAAVALAATSACDTRVHEVVFDPDRRRRGPARRHADLRRGRSHSDLDVDPGQRLHPGLRVQRLPQGHRQRGRPACRSRRARPTPAWSARTAG